MATASSGSRAMPKMLGLIRGQMGSLYADDYRKAHPWSTKYGSDLNTAAFDWNKAGRTEAEAKPEGWRTQQEWTDYTSDLQSQIDQLKIPKVASSVTQSSPGLRDKHGGWGSQDTSVDNVKIAQATAKKKTTSSAPKLSQTYTGSASL